MRIALGLLVALLAGGAAPARAIIHPDGAGRVSWQALVSAKVSATKVQRCGATVRDALHVITAAHCTYNRRGQPLSAAALTVTAGITDAAAPEATAQSREVVAISSDPAFVLAGASAVNDDAILTLESSLDLADADVVRALPLADPGQRATTGGFAGFGRTSRHGHGGRLHQATLDLLAPRACSGFGVSYSPATMLCAGRVHADGRATGACNGDSGGGLVAGGQLLGIASFTGAQTCGDRRFPTVFTRVDAPAINAFLRQPEPLPRPAVLEPPALVGDASAMRCLPGRTEGVTSMTFAFERAPLVGRTADPARGVVVAPFSPSDTYLPIARDIGAAIFCVARAVNGGGAANATSANGIGLVGSVRLR